MISINIQNGREIGAIILTDDYLCYKESKIPLNFFLILIFNELFKFETSDEWQRWETGTSSLYLVLSLRSVRVPFAFITALPWCSDRKICIKFYLILRKLHRTRKIFLKNNVTSLYDKPTDVIFFRIISNNISSTTWTK